MSSARMIAIVLAMLLALLNVLPAAANNFNPRFEPTRSSLQAFDPDQTTLALEPAYSGFAQPLRVTNAGDGTGRLLVVEKAGRIKVIENGQVLEEPFLDIVDLVESSNLEQGLFSVAFHPDYENNGRLFIVYTAEPDGSNVLASVKVSDNPNVADRSTLSEIFSIPNRFVNHNSGDVAFGPDGYLYYSTGDGGGAGDPDNNAQNPQALLGKMLRIDVDNGDPYAIPPDNPFVNNSDFRPEIWAYGLRNPWRYSFDRLTGDLYIVDVSQDSWEELNFQPANSSGGENYGWSIMEGTHCYPPWISDCDASVLTLPILEYPNDVSGPPPSGCAITAGNVYRGSDYPFMDGVFLFGDWCTGQIYAGYRVGEAWQMATLLDTDLGITSFGEDESGELYLTSMYDGGVYRLTFETTVSDFDDPAFVRNWARTDLPVRDQLVSRTWIWGPNPITFGMEEPYAESPGEKRVVQYFDKSRMEITHPSGDPNSLWYVTNGLLVVEMMDGLMQVGDALFEQRQPAEINVAGDCDDPDGVTYATMAELRAAVPYADGETITSVLHSDGTLSDDTVLAAFGVTASPMSLETGHRTASIFWEFMNSTGLIYESGTIFNDLLFENPYYATGLPVTEAYWTMVDVDGIERLVLVQCFERRCVTYTPDNSPGWQVEAGNVGLHYFDWRYSE